MTVVVWWVDDCGGLVGCGVWFGWCSSSVCVMSG